MALANATRMPIMSLHARGTGGKPTAPIPVFGRACVCCNRDARGLIRNVTPQSHHRVLLDGIDVPVCTECVDHALLPVTQAVLVAMMVGLGIVSAGLGVSYRSEGRDPTATGWAIAIGALLVAAAVVLSVLAVRRERRERRRDGHFPYLTMSVRPGTTELVTRNPILIDELRRLNPDARFHETRAERKRVPHARAVSLPDARPSPEAEANIAKVVAQVTKNTPESLAAARAMLAAGDVNAIVVEHRLAELEAVLGRRDLRERLRAISPGR